MSLLELRGVCKRYRNGSRECQPLRDVSLELHSGEIVGIWGLRHSGRSTLLRIAAGLERPDQGAVYLDGRELSDGALDGQIAYCHPALTVSRLSCLGGGREHVLGVLLGAQLARGVSLEEARRRAHETLARTGAQDSSELAVAELDGGEAVRVTLALALMSRPALLIIDEPTKSVDLLEREPIQRLLRSLADEGLAILICVSETSGLFGVDRALALGEGELNGKLSPELAQVVALPLQVSA
jgi:ABC-type sugar transport system ATPase subunit